PSRHGSNRLRSSAPPLQPLLRPVYDPSGVVSEIRFKNRLADNNKNLQTQSPPNPGHSRMPARWPWQNDYNTVLDTIRALPART
ncbi:MAG: hypothetical protein ACR2QA_06775, partial [Solirubrobacteraceae bacterium]